MSLLPVVVLSAVVLSIAYVTYGRFLARLLRLDPNKATPAVEFNDGLDFEPIEPKFLLSQHFSAIAAAGPIVGPILAGIAFGWVPALIWILVGSVFIGGVHDMTALVASIRHKARSIAEVVRDHMTRRSYLLFLSFVWIALVYIIVAFTDVTASSFLGIQTLENDEQISGGGVASSSLMYLVLPIIMGLLLRYTKLSIGWATAIFMPLVGVAIWAGQSVPFSVDEFFGVQPVVAKLPAMRTEVEGVLSGEQVTLYRKSIRNVRDTFVVAGQFAKDAKLTDEQSAKIQAITAPLEKEYNVIMSQAQRTWDVALLAYCLIAAVVPVWLLLQPRGHLGGYFLYVALGGGMLGLILGGGEVKYPAFTNWVATSSGMEQSLVPFLFITIACGACSGFHSIIASGTTSKQLRCEPDARVIGYGSMLLEAMVAIVSLCCVMMLAPGDPTLKRSPNYLYAAGIGNFLGALGIPATFGISFGLMAFTTFVYDTLDVCTRLGRYIIQELTGWHNRFGRWLGTALTAGAPLFFLLQPGVDANGKLLPPVWKTFWNLFGASNQLLAALTLLGVTVWLWRTRGEKWVWFVTGIPTVVMYVMSTWALVSMTWPKFFDGSGAFAAPREVVPWVGVVLLGLAALMLVEAVAVLAGGRSSTPPQTGKLPAAVPT
jgi:carbon starvation protein CstA